MKKTNEQANIIIKQLKGAECVIDYCCKIASAFYGAKNFLSGYEPRFISFAHTGTGSSQRTRLEQPQAKHNTPENMMKIGWPANIHFKHIAG